MDGVKNKFSFYGRIEGMIQLSTLIFCITISTAGVSQDQSKQSKEISVFFKEIVNSDLNNVEFKEGSNERLFMLLEANPAAFIASLGKANAETSKRITEELKSPVHDGIDLQKIYSIVYNVKSDQQSKTLILEALKEAGNKLGLEFTNK